MIKQLTVILGVFEWIVEKDPESGQQVAECSALNLLAWGGTNDELLGCIRRVTGMLLKHLVETGQLDSFMGSRGFPVVTMSVQDSPPEPLPAPDWTVPEDWTVPQVPVLWPTTRITDASLVRHA